MDRHSASTRRLSRGSIRPSSHRRAVANRAVLSFSILPTTAAFMASSFLASTGLPSRLSFSSVTMASTPAACSGPITAMRLLGQAKMKAGS